MFCYAHYSTGKKILELSHLNLDDDARKAFYSGLIYADIGKFNLDKKTKVESDSKKFLEKLKKHAKTKLEEWFLIGISVHIFTDKKMKNLLKNIFKSPTCGYISYLKRCSILEYYFLKKTKSYVFFFILNYFNIGSMLFNIDFLNTHKLFKETKDFLENRLKKVIDDFYINIDKINLKLPVSILTNTYNDLGIFLSEKALKTQAANLIGASVLSCAFMVSHNDNKNSEKISKSIEREIKKLCKQGVSFLKRKVYFKFMF